MPVIRKPPRLPYKPHILVSIAAGVESQSPGVLLAVLHYSARDIVILRQHELEGFACPHVEEPTEDLKALDKIVAQAKAIAQALRIPVKVDKDALANLVWGDIDDAP